MKAARDRCRFAPSPTGHAHPGTLLAGLLCWLDARSRDAHLEFRLEDLDPDRCKPEYAQRIPEDLAWLGLDFDAFTLQSEHRERHEEAFDELAAQGLLYPCACTRTTIREHGVRTPDGGFRYPGTCRERALPTGGWRASTEPLRLRLPEGRVELVDESGADLSQDPEAAFGDPLVNRRDGAAAYHLAVVVDDAASGITRIVRGRDLANATATQVRIQRLLGLPPPTYRHHPLLLESRNQKLAKFHGAFGLEALRPRYGARDLCGFLAWRMGLQPTPDPTTPRDLLATFSWSNVTPDDQLLRLEDGTLL